MRKALAKIWSQFLRLSTVSCNWSKQFHDTTNNGWIFIHSLYCPPSHPHLSSFSSYPLKTRKVTSWIFHRNTIYMPFLSLNATKLYMLQHWQILTLLNARFLSSLEFPIWVFTSHSSIGRYFVMCSQITGNFQRSSWCCIASLLSRP